MSKIILYSHGGSGNHGCEAIVRGTYKILEGKVSQLFSYRKNEDEKYGLSNLLEVKDHTQSYSKFSLKRIIASLRIHLMHDEEYAEKITYDVLFDNLDKGDIAISIGGDNYCYDSFGEYELCNKYLTKKGVKTVLWGCSVEPSKINARLAKDLATYDLIITRESITYEAVKKVNKNTYLYPDPAFQLDIKEIKLPKQFDENVIGINISPMIINNEKNKGMTKNNYVKLMNYILDNTDYKIALIPHVVWSTNDDRLPIKDLYDEFNHNPRILVFDDHTCEELKYIISRCKLFIGARTHSTIAAYSTCVPTLVVGYSVKAKGIAKDLFGSYDDYVIPVQNLKNEDDLLNHFQFFLTHETEIRKHLQDIMPAYKNQVESLPGKIFEL